MANFLAPPTYADVITMDEVSKKPSFNPEWLNWFLQIAQSIGVSGGPGGGVQHNALAGLQGGGGTEFFHLTNSVYSLLNVVAASTYTPTLTNTTNITSSTAHLSQYLRIGSMVVVGGQADATPTVAGNTALGISLPIASNFGATSDCTGTANSPSIVEGAAILADVANHRAQMQWNAVSASGQNRYYIFIYRII